MKKFIVACLALLPLSAMAQKFAHYNSVEVMNAMPEYTTAQEELQKLATTYQEEYQRLLKEYQTKGEELQRLQQEGKTPEAILQNKYQDFQKMEQAIQDFSQSSQSDIQKQQGEKMQSVAKKLEGALQKVAEAGQYVYVMDINAAQVTSPVTFVNTHLSTDITAEVKTALGLK